MQSTMYALDFSGDPAPKRQSNLGRLRPVEAAQNSEKLLNDQFHPPLLSWLTSPKSTSVAVQPDRTSLVRLLCRQKIVIALKHNGQMPPFQQEPE
jgi:hypothetical protein